MSESPLLLYPDPGLRRAADPIERFDAALASLAEQVRGTLARVGAIGLTAPHIGRLQRLVVLRLEPGEPTTTYVNPEILWASPERQTHTEGSVSMPGIAESVERAARITLRYRDLDGTPREESAEGFRAACLQHECDQLDGIFWIDRLSRLRRERALKRFVKLRRTDR